MFATTRIGLLKNQASGLRIVGTASADGMGGATVTMPAGCQIGDIVVLFVLAYRDRDTAGSPTITTSGYTLQQSTFYGARNELHTKRFTSAVDSAVAVTSPSGTRCVCLVHVWRGVNATTPMDVAPTRTSGSMLPPAITPVTQQAVVLAMGGGGDSSSAIPSAPTGYSNAVARAPLTGSTYARAILVSKVWSGSGAEAPPLLATAGTTAAGAITAALRPE